MRVKAFREFLKDFPDDTEVIVEGNHGVLHRADVKTGYAEPFNRLGQTHAGLEPSGNYTEPVVIIGRDAF